jgi:hypothetical protein
MRIRERSSVFSGVTSFEKRTTRFSNSGGDSSWNMTALLHAKNQRTEGFGKTLGQQGERNG